MPYRSGGGFLIVMSAVFFVLGLFAAAQRKRWLLMASYFAFLVSILLLLYALTFISDDRLRMWVGFPLAGLSFPDRPAPSGPA
jgi:hypothetical protein